MRPEKRWSDDGMPASLFEGQGICGSHFLAHPDTTAAQDTKVIIPVVERVFFFDTHIPIVDGMGDIRNTHFVDYILQFTLTVTGTIAAASGDTNLADGPHVVFAFIRFVTNKAA